MTFAGTVNLLMATAMGEWAHATWSWRGVSALLYLLVLGSWVAFSAYVWLLHHVPITKVSTYAYKSGSRRYFGLGSGGRASHRLYPGRRRDRRPGCRLGHRRQAKTRTKRTEEQQSLAACGSTAD